MGKMTLYFRQYIAVIIFLAMKGLVLCESLSNKTDVVTERACLPDPTFAMINQTIECEDYATLELLDVRVGYSLSFCDMAYCSLHLLSNTNEYHRYLKDICQDKPKCLLSSVVLFGNYSNTSFPICGHGGRARNSVEISYRCVISGTIPTTTRRRFLTTKAVNQSSEAPKYNTTSASYTSVVEPSQESPADEIVADHRDILLLNVVIPVLSVILLISLIILIACFVQTKRFVHHLRRSESSCSSESSSPNYVSADSGNLERESGNVNQISDRILYAPSDDNEQFGSHLNRGLHCIDEVSEADSSNNSLVRTEPIAKDRNSNRVQRPRIKGDLSTENTVIQAKLLLIESFKNRQDTMGETIKPALFQINNGALAAVANNSEKDQEREIDTMHKTDLYRDIKLSISNKKVLC